MILLVIGLLISLSTGALVVWMLAPRPQSPVVVLLQLSISIVVGLALTSLTHFIALQCFGGGDGRILFLDGALLIGLCIISVVTNRSGPSEDLGSVEPPPPMPIPAGPRSILDRIILAGTVIACICAATSMLSLLVGRPHGNWDAWAMWNMRARFLFLAGPDWRLTFGEEMTGVHPDYPLLQPLVVARFWTLLGDDSTIIPRLTAALFATATAVMLFTSVCRLHGRTAACIALTVLVSAPVFADEAASQFADMPVACYCLASIVAMAGAFQAQYGINRLFALSGLCAGCAAWTKNEGDLILAAVVSASFAFMWRSHGLRRAIRSVIVMLAGAAPMLLLVITAKMSFSWRNDLFEDRSLADTLALFADPARYRAFGHWFAELLPGIISPWLFALLALLIIANRLDAGTRERPSSSTRNARPLAAATALALVALGYTCIYLTTPHEIGWHLRTSLSRLILHLWPGFLFVVFSTMPALGCRESVSLTSSRAAS